MDENEVSRLFDAMYRHCEGGSVEFRYLPSKKRIFVPLDDFAVPQFPKGENIYFGVGTRDGKRGTKDNIVQIPALWADIDFKDTPEDEANERLKHFPLQPTAKVISGNGIHPYWLLKEPYGKEDIPTIESYNRRLIEYFSADPQRAEAASTMRVPGTLNHKYDPPRKAELVHCDASLAYELDDFDQYLPEVSGQAFTPSEKLDGIVLSLPVGPFSVEAIGQPINEGHRDQFLWHVSNQLAKSNTPQNVLKQVAYLLGEKGCKPSLSEKQIGQKIESALKRAEMGRANYSEKLDEYLKELNVGQIFETRNLYVEWGVTKEKDKANIRQTLKRRKEQGVIEPHNRAGQYRKIDSSCKPMNLKDVDTSREVDLKLPLGVEELVRLLPRNIIVVTALPDQGKTAYMLNTAQLNLDKWNVHYFNSEMGDLEFKKRVELFEGFDMDHPHFHPYEKESDFHTVIKPGDNDLNIIDFLEFYEDFYSIGKVLNEIHKKLGDAIAIVAIQRKDSSTDLPLGGYRGIEKARLAMSMGNNQIKIIKGKNRRNPKINPNGLAVGFKLVNGCKFISVGEWSKEDYSTD
jgi:hypothetical protein